MKRTSKRNLTILLSIVLVAVLATGITLAYLFAKTEVKENVFTFAKNITGNLDEPNWNEEDAKNLVPGKDIPKDPQITNTSENGVAEYAAMKLTFLDGSGKVVKDEDVVKLLNLIGIDWSDSWKLADGALSVDDKGVVTEATAEQIYVYNRLLPQGITTDPIFNIVTIKSSITPDELTWLAGDYGHQDSCYEFGKHSDDVCKITYWHHNNCAIVGEAEASQTEKGGTVGGKACNCEPSVVHESDCPSLIKALKNTCEHKTVISGLGNFTIKAEGAVVQADAFNTIEEATVELKKLFK